MENEIKTNLSYADILRETQQEEFSLLSEVTRGVVDAPLSLMNAHTDDDGVVVPCALPDAMMQSLPQMMSETLSLYDDADIRTMLLMAMMPTIGSAMSNVRVRHGQRLYSLGMMNICVGPSASGKGSVGDVASLVDGINDIICSESAQAQADHRKRHKRYSRLTSQLTYAAKGDVTNLIDVNDIAEEVDEPHRTRSRSTLPLRAEAFRDVYTYHRRQLTEIWSALRQFDGKPEEELPRLIISDEQRKLIDEYYRQMVSFVALALPDKDLRAPILRSRLNFYRMLMIVAVLRRHEEMGSAEELFAEKLFTVAEADLRWGLAYIFYTLMQTSTIYDRLRREEKEEEAKRAYISALGFLHALPTRFTTAEAKELGDRLGIKQRAVDYKLRTLLNRAYIQRIGYGAFRKMGTKRNSVA